MGNDPKTVAAIASMLMKYELPNICPHVDLNYEHQ